MLQSLAFLSYTRKDDEFFGGYITAFRKMLENAVHVVTGETTFQIFQDVEGIVIGENWQKKLAQAINESSFLVPMLSPLFLNSRPCRDEVTQFLEHERTLDRDDLILPVYFLSSAKLEKEEEKTKDPLAMELAKRQMFDWRTRADVPLQEPAARKAILDLAGGIAERLKAFDVKPVAEDQRPISEPGYEILEADPRLSAGVAGNPKREELSPRAILWVDDNPDNNVWERRALESYGVRFVLARDTAEAEQMVSEEGPFAAIISDLGRVDDRQAGFTLLKRIRQTEIDTPYFIYTTSDLATMLRPVTRLRGAQGITADPDALVQMVVAAIR